MNSTELDEGKRCSEAVNIHLRVVGPEAIGKWVAIRLSDGGSDMVLYDKKADAIRHQLDEFLCAYVCIPPNGMPPSDAVRFLRATRQMYASGVRLADPDKHVIVRN
jgi:hypothetical protein